MKTVEALSITEDGITIMADMGPTVVEEKPVSFHSYKEPLVVEEPDFLPGSDLILAVDVPEEKADTQEIKKETNWTDDQDFTKFLSYMNNEVKHSIPKHSGETIPGCERAIAFLKSKLSEIDKAIKQDLKGEIDEKAADALCTKIEDDIEKLEKHKETLKKNKKTASLDVRIFASETCPKCNNNAPMWHNVAENKMECMACDNTTAADNTLTKEAGTAKINMYISAFERAIVGIIINATVSSGKNIEETYFHLKNKYDFSPREELAIAQLVEDYGYPLYLDRGTLNEGIAVDSENGEDFVPNYYA